MSEERPTRNTDVEINEVSDGYVVYDEARDRVHYLNRTAAVVLEFCTGDNTVEDIVALLRAAYDLQEPPAAETNACLDQLRTEGLIH